MTESPVWDVERMRPLVLEWDAAVRAEVPAYERLVPEAEARGSVLRAPASEAQIATAEARLELVLPPSYRSFLLVANGADAGRLGADSIHRLGTTEPTGLLSVEDVVMFSDAVPELVAMWRDAMDQVADRQREPTAEEPTQVCDFEPGLRALLLTQPAQLAFVALVPCAGEWQVWEFDHSEVSAHQSFAAFLQHQARWARYRVARTEERIRETAGPFCAIDIRNLADRGDPRALDAACRALPEASEPGKRDTVIVVGTLHSLGDARAIPVLRAALGRVSDDGLRFMLLMALDICGDPESPGDLQRLIDTAAPSRRAWPRTISNGASDSRAGSAPDTTPQRLAAAVQVHPFNGMLGVGYERAIDAPHLTVRQYAAAWQETSSITSSPRFASARRRRRAPTRNRSSSSGHWRRSTRAQWATSANGARSRVGPRAGRRPSRPPAAPGVGRIARRFSLPWVSGRAGRRARSRTSPGSRGTPSRAR